MGVGLIRRLSSSTTCPCCKGCPTSLAVMMIWCSRRLWSSTVGSCRPAISRRSPLASPVSRRMTSAAPHCTRSSVGWSLESRAKSPQTGPSCIFFTTGTIDRSFNACFFWSTAAMLSGHRGPLESRNYFSKCIRPLQLHLVKQGG